MHRGRCQQPGHRDPGRAAPPLQSEGAGARAQAGPRRLGEGVPYLEQHKEPEQRQEAAAAARPRGQVPHRGVDGDTGER